VADDVSKSQIDRLGDRLRQETVTETDLRMLDDHRRSFRSAYVHVVDVIRSRFRFDVTGRLKTTRSIIDKLRRETIRLSQPQDIAGCRVVVADLVEQDRAVSSLREVLPDASVVDRRSSPSYGYRAIHVIVTVTDRLVEIQVRTRLQHLWAELSEKCSDVFDDPAIKYGGGRDDVRRMLQSASELVADGESAERPDASWRLLEQMLRERIAALEALRRQSE
jgi:ppGpp synthetase/RelA/SpoT-type nucleotidyltranferase